MDMARIWRISAVPPAISAPVPPHRDVTPASLRRALSDQVMTGRPHLTFPSCRRVSHSALVSITPGRRPPGAREPPNVAKASTPNPGPPCARHPFAAAGAETQVHSSSGHGCADRPLCDGAQHEHMSGHLSNTDPIYGDPAEPIDCSDRPPRVGN